MSNNFFITQGIGTLIAADQGPGNELYQKIKLFDPTAGSASGIGIASNPLRVDPTGTTTQPVSGSVSVSNFPATQPISAVSLPLPTGASTSANQSTIISDLASILANQTNGTQETQVTNFPTTQAVTQSGSWNVGLNAGANTIGKVDQGNGGSSAWKVDGSAVTQPISAASLPLPAGASTSANQSTIISDLASILANQTNGTQETQVTNFPATQPISATSLPLPTGASTSANQVTANSSLSSILSNQTNGTQHTLIDNFPGTQPVSGTVTANQGTAAALSGAWPVEITDGSSILGTSANPIRVDTTGTTTQPISAASLPLPTGAATAANQSTANTSLASILANQTNGTQETQVTNFPATQAISAVSLPLPTGAATAANQSTANTSLASILANQTNGTQVVSGTVTANAGTNLNTSALALESGGNLASVKTNTDRPSVSASFQASVTTSEAALPTNTAKSIALKAPATNTDNVYVGTTGVTASTGYLLEPGDSVGMDVTNSNALHAVSASGTQTLTGLVLN